MSLRHAILGLLTYQPMSGYTLKSQYFDRSIAHFWPADQAQIYRTLQALEADGAVESRTVAGTARPDSRLYSITPEGEAELVDWLGGARALAVQKDAFLVQIYFGRLLSRDQLLAVLSARRDEHARLLRDYEAMELPVAETDLMRQQIRFGGLTLDFGRRRERMMIEWLDASIATIATWPTQAD